MKSVTFSNNVRKLKRNGGGLARESLPIRRKYEQYARFDGGGKLWYNEVQSKKGK